MEDIKQELEKATFIPYNINGEDEENYGKAKAFFLSTQESITTSIKKCVKSLEQANESYKWFTQMKKDLTKKHPDTNVDHLDNTIKSLEQTIKQLETTLETNNQRLAEVEFIVNNCFTETIQDNVAIVQNDGLIFSKYFALVLKGME